MTTTQNGMEKSPTNSGGVLGSYRFFFSAHHGGEGNYGYARNTQKYTSADGVKTNTHEVSGAYVFLMAFGRITAFALAGVGVFAPKDFEGASNQTRAAFIYGTGADFNLSHHIFVRAEYGGFVYNSPTYDLPILSGLDRVPHRAEPSAGFGYRLYEVSMALRWLPGDQVSQEPDGRNSGLPSAAQSALWGERYV